MEEKELQELEQALRAASPPPWRLYGCEFESMESRFIGEAQKPEDAAAIAALRNAAPSLISDLRSARKARDSAYAERNQVVAAMAEMARRLGWWAGVAQHQDKPGEAWESDWRTIVFIDLPTGQVSWHFHDSEKHLLAAVPPYPLPWDGHDTPEKYRRVRALIGNAGASPPPDSVSAELREARELLKEAMPGAYNAGLNPLKHRIYVFLHGERSDREQSEPSK